MFLNLLANATEMVNGTYPGGASLNDPVPSNVEYYGSEWLYMGLAFVVFCAAVFAVSRLNVDR